MALAEPEIKAVTFKAYIKELVIYPLEIPLSGRIELVPTGEWDYEAIKELYVYQIGPLRVTLQVDKGECPGYIL